MKECEAVSIQMDEWKSIQLPDVSITNTQKRCVKKSLKASITAVIKKGAGEEPAVDQVKKSI